MAAIAKTCKRTAHVIHERERTSDVLTEENTNVDFASMFLSEPVTLGLEKVGFERPSPIQLKAIPLGRCGLDLIVQAKSGTGKTCVFSVVALEGIDLSNPTTQVLVLAPTREIAVQIQDTIQAIGCEMEALRCHVFIGGTMFGPDRQKMKRCHIAVGTPGRIKQLIEYEVLKTDAIRLFVLDEADKLLDDTFQEQVNWIYNQLSDNKQMLALSATYPEYLAKHLTKYMREPMFVRLNPKDLALRGIKQFYVESAGHSLPNKAFEIKVVKLMKILSQVSFNQCLIFSNLQTRAQNLCDILDDCGWPSECISGAKEQSQRLSAMAKLKKFQCRILISTDLTARGIDAENVNLIINLDIPTDSKTYLHRIGRAGRFGTHGASISLASKGREMELLQNIQRQCRVMMTELPDPAPSDLLKQDINPTGPKPDSASLTSSSTKDLMGNNSIDNLEDDVQSGDNAVATSLILNGQCHKPQSFVKKTSTVNGNWHISKPVSNGSDSDIVSLASDGFGFLKLELTEGFQTLEKRKDSFISSKTEDVVKSTVSSSLVVEETGGGLIQQVDVGIQTMEEDLVPINALVPQSIGVTASGDHRERSTMPIGFEDAREFMEMNLPLWGQAKRADSTRRACTWYEARESFKKFMKERTVADRTHGYEDNAMGSNECGNGQSVKENEQVFVDAKGHDCNLSEVDFPSGNSEVIKGEKLDKGSQIKNEDMVQKITAQESVQKETCGITALREVAKYQELLSNAFIGNYTNKGDVLMNISHGNHEEVIESGSKGNMKDSLESPTPALDHPAVSEKHVTKDVRKGNVKPEASAKQILKSTEGLSSPIDHDALKANGITCVGQDVVNPQADCRGYHQSSTNSVKKSMLPVKELYKNAPLEHSTTGKRKGRPQRTKQHIFQMSTLGALMSPKEFDQALVGIPNSSSCDGDLNTNDTDKEKVEMFSQGNKVHVNDNVCHTQDLDAHTVPYEQLKKPESSARDSPENIKLVIHKNVPQENDSSISDDPVWAIFKNFESAVLPSEVKRKEAESSDPIESSEESSSSLCESDTSTCSSTSSEDDSGSTTNEESFENESDSEWKGNKSMPRENGKKHDKEYLISNESASGRLNEDCTYKESYSHYPSWSADPSSNRLECYTEEQGYDESLNYYPGGIYNGWQYPYYSPNAFPNRYANEYYQGGYSQQSHVYSGYPYPFSFAPYYGI